MGKHAEVIAQVVSYAVVATGERIGRDGGVYYYFVCPRCEPIAYAAHYAKHRKEA